MPAQSHPSWSRGTSQKPLTHPTCELLPELSLLWASWAMGSMPSSCFSDEDFGVWLVTSRSLSLKVIHCGVTTYSTGINSYHEVRWDGDPAYCLF